MNLNLCDSQVVVVGGTNGIGLAIAKNFLSEGAVVHIISRKKNYKLIDDLEKLYPSKVFFYESDATNQQSLNSTAKKILKNSGNNINILISNVGNGSGTLNVIPSRKDWDSSWNINFTSALNSTRIFSKFILKSRGSIIFISSIAGIEDLGAPISYSTAKSALITFAKVLSNQLSPYVRVNVVAPGNVWVKNGTWDLKQKSNPDLVDKIISEKVALKRFGMPEEISDLVVFVSSDRASFITGSCLVIDGGQTRNF